MRQGEGLLPLLLVGCGSRILYRSAVQCGQSCQRNRSSFRAVLIMMIVVVVVAVVVAVGHVTT